MKTLLKNACIYTPQGVIRDGFVAVDGTMIAAVGAARPEGDFDREKDMSGKLLLPGLVNAHTHAAMTLLRGVGTDLPLQRWLFDSVFPVEARLTGEDIRIGTALALLEMLACGTTSFTDMVFGTITVNNSDLDDSILIKADGMPTYNFANVVDDHLMKISHVMRGMEYLSSTPKYNLLYEAFGWEIPHYIHMTPIMRDAQHKLSKRDGDASYADFVDKGYLKEALVNYVALLGWNPGDDREIFSLSELCEAFDVSGMSKSPAIFDPEKLTWMNAQYIMALSKEEFTRHAMPWYEKAGIAHMDTDILCRILQQRVRVFNEIPDMVDFLTKLDEGYDAALFTNKKSKTDSLVSKNVLEMVIPVLEALPNWNEELLHGTLIGMAAEKGMKNGTLLWPVRIALAGKAVTPGGAIEIAVLLGRDESLKRLKAGRAKV